MLRKHCGYVTKEDCSLGTASKAEIVKSELETGGLLLGGNSYRSKEGVKGTESCITLYIFVGCPTT